MSVWCPSRPATGVHNFLTNLNEPVVFANDVLQGDPDWAGRPSAASPSIPRSA